MSPIEEARARFLEDVRALSPRARALLKKVLLEIRAEPLSDDWKPLGFPFRPGTAEARREFPGFGTLVVRFSVTIDTELRIAWLHVIVE